MNDFHDVNKVCVIEKTEGLPRRFLLSKLQLLLSEEMLLVSINPVFDLDNPVTSTSAGGQEQYRLVGNNG